MTELEEGDPILFMKVGTHASEGLEEIIERKTAEIDQAGYAMWGYGGNTCYPTRVQPFAADQHQAGRIVRLVMQPMESKHFADPVRAGRYSVDGISWDLVPEDINVLGSRFALCIDKLELADFNLSLDRTTVAIGMNTGRAGNDYIKGRVDKACLTVAGHQDAEDGIHIGLVANLIAPYAVFLKN